MYAYCCSTDPAIFCDACIRITVWSTWFIYGLSFQWNSQVLYIHCIFSPGDWRSLLLDHNYKRKCLAPRISGLDTFGFLVIFFLDHSLVHLLVWLPMPIYWSLSLVLTILSLIHVPINALFCSSTVSSGLNSLAAVVLEDFIKPWCRNRQIQLSEIRATLYSKLLGERTCISWEHS